MKELYIILGLTGFMVFWIIAACYCHKKADKRNEREFIKHMKKHNKFYDNWEYDNSYDEFIQKRGKL